MSNEAVMNNRSELLKISSIEVANLFGRFNHRVPLNIEEDITIIHAPNGHGKTVFLKLISALIGGKFGELLRYQYDSFKIVFEDGTGIVATQMRQKDMFEGEEDGRLSERIVRLEPVGIADKNAEPHVIDARIFRKSMVKRSHERIFHNIGLERISANAWLEFGTGRRLTNAQVYDEFGDVLPIDPEGADSVPDWLADRVKRAAAVLIETQRLIPAEELDQEGRYERRVSEKRTKVELKSDSLKRRIARAISTYASRSQQLDRSFPQRVVQGMSAPPNSKELLRAELLALGEKNTRLEESGLLNSERQQGMLTFQQLTDELDDENVRKILTVYLESSYDKVRVFDELYERITLFTELINRKFSYKRLVVSDETGFHVVDDSDRRIPLRSLSSGEQHEIVLLYDLIFLTRPNSLVMIDEPEISLHVSWQSKFLDDLDRIAELSRAAFLVATHSPQIIGDRTNLLLPLGRKI